MKIFKKYTIIFGLTLFFALLLTPITLTVKTSGATPVGISTSTNKTFAKKSTVTKVLTKDASLPADRNGQWVHDLYKVCLNILNIALVVILMVVAFASIFNINIETYSVKKALPKVVAIAVLANLAMPIFAALSSIVDAMQNLNLFRERIAIGPQWLLQGIDIKQIMHTGGITAFLGMLFTGSLSIVGALIGILFALLSCILPLILYLLLAFRPYILYLGIAVSPLALACFILPQTQNLYKKWLNIVSAWMFWPILAYAIINAADLIPKPKVVGAGSVFTITFLVGLLLPAIIRGALLILSIRIPFMIEKDVSSLLAKIGKTTGSGLVTAGASMGDYAYKYKKYGGFAAEQKAQAKATGELATFDGLDNAGQEGFLRNLARRNVESRGEAITDESVNAEYEAMRAEVDANNGALTDEQKQAYINREASVAKDKFNQNMTTRLISGAGTALSMPMGLYIAFKSNKELMAKEREKSSQKILFQSSPQFLKGFGDKYDQFANNQKNETARFALQFLKRRMSPFATSNARGELGDLKYFEAIATDDLKGRLTPEQILKHMNMLKDQMKKIRENASNMGLTSPEEQAEFIKSTFQDYYTGAEGVIAWDRSPLTQGLTAAEKAKLKVIWGRFNEERNRELQLQFRGDRVGKEAQLNTDLIGIVQGQYRGTPVVAQNTANNQGDSAAPSSPTLPDPVDHTLDDPDVKESGAHEREVVSSLASIEKAIKDKSGFEAIKSALTTANLNGTDPVMRSVNIRNNQSLREISAGMKRSGLGDQQISEAMEELQQSTLSNMDEVLTKHVPSNADQGLQQAFQQFRATKVHQELSGHMMESGASTARIAQTAVANIPVEIRPQVKAACDQVIKYQMKLDPQISEADYNNASKIIADHIPTVGTQTGSGQGFDISASTAAHVARGIEATTEGQ